MHKGFLNSFICNQELRRRLTVERVQWLMSSLENRAASLMNTAKAFRMNVAKSWTWMKLRAQRSLLLINREQ